MLSGLSSSYCVNTGYSKYIIIIMIWRVQDNVFSQTDALKFILYVAFGVVVDNNYYCIIVSTKGRELQFF